MATLNFEVEYDQARDSLQNGSITFRYAGDSGMVSATMPANGRLDAVSDMVMSMGTFPVTLNGAEFDASVECTRTSVDSMSVTVSFFGTVLVQDKSWTGEGSGYGYTDSQQLEPVLQTVIEDVPIDH